MKSKVKSQRAKNEVVFLILTFYLFSKQQSVQVSDTTKA